MKPLNAPPNRLTTALSDIHFWVPATILICGLLLLRMFL